MPLIGLRRNGDTPRYYLSEFFELISAFALLGKKSKFNYCSSPRPLSA